MIADGRYSLIASIATGKSIEDLFFDGIIGLLKKQIGEICKKEKINVIFINLSQFSQYRGWRFIYGMCFVSFKEEKQMEELLRSILYNGCSESKEEKIKTMLGGIIYSFVSEMMVEIWNKDELSETIAQFFETANFIVKREKFSYEQKKSF